MGDGRKGFRNGGAVLPACCRGDLICLREGISPVSYKTFDGKRKSNPGEMKHAFATQKRRGLRHLTNPLAQRPVASKDIAMGRKGSSSFEKKVMDKEICTGRGGGGGTCTLPMTEKGRKQLFPC